ncbi:MAG: hypothetical protein RLZZ182_419 [Pseudomonadota bacterium]|jgi:hypothetical protein
MPDERLSPNFWLSEFLRSDIATRRGLCNTPCVTALLNIRTILAPGMQQVRNILGQPVFITSGYRSAAVNKAVGGSQHSQHVQGLAADFICPSLGMPRTVAEYLLQHSTLQFDQLIHEGAWLHVSFVPSKPRHEVLTAHFDGGHVTYTNGLH